MSRLGDTPGSLLASAEGPQNRIPHQSRLNRVVLLPRAVRAHLNGSAIAMRVDYLEDWSPRGAAGCVRDAGRGRARPRLRETETEETRLWASEPGRRVLLVEADLRRS